MSKLKVKSSDVNVWGLQVQMQPVLKAAEKVWDEFGLPLVVTSARDGIHSCGSLHYYGYAVDFRTWDKEAKQIDAATRKALVKRLQTILLQVHKSYQVISHDTHIHVEFDMACKGCT